MVLVRQRPHGEVVGEGARPLEGGEDVRVGRGHEVAGMKHHRRHSVEDLAVRTHWGWGEKMVGVAADMTIEHGPSGAGGTGLLHPVGDVEEVGVVIRVGGVVGGPGQGPRLVAVRRAAPALSVLVISVNKSIQFLIIKT